MLALTITSSMTNAYHVTSRNTSEQLQKGQIGQLDRRFLVSASKAHELPVNCIVSLANTI
jgi:hypothetical protein